MPTTSPRALMDASTVCVEPAGTNSWYLKFCPWAALPNRNRADTANWHSLPFIANFKLALKRGCMALRTSGGGRNARRSVRWKLLAQTVAETYLQQSTSNEYTPKLTRRDLVFFTFLRLGKVGGIELQDFATPREAARSKGFDGFDLAFCSPL